MKFNNNDFVFLFLVFILINSKFMYSMTNNLTLKSLNLFNQNGVPTYLGLVLHTLIFCIVINFYLQSKRKF